MRIGKLVPRIGPVETPLIPADIWCWYDFADTGTLVVSGGKISFVADKSGQGHNGIQATSALQPTLSTVNSLTAALFSRANQTVMQSLSVPVVAQPTTWFCVFTQDTATSANYFPCIYNGLGSGVPATTFGQELFQNDLTNDLCIEASDVFSHLAGTVTTPHTQKQVSAVYKGTSSYMFIDTVPGTTTSGSPVIGTAGFQGVTIGNNEADALAGADGALDGKLCELMVYNREVTSGERLAVEAYLKAKWGTP